MTAEVASSEDDEWLPECNVTKEKTNMQLSTSGSTLGLSTPTAQVSILQLTRSIPEEYLLPQVHLLVTNLILLKEYLLPQVYPLVTNLISQYSYMEI